MIGNYKLTESRITKTLFDTRILFGFALKSCTTEIIVCHNHPSGNINFLRQDNNQSY